jgi:hypothetical protein
MSSEARTFASWLKLGFNKAAVRKVLKEGTPISLDNIDQIAILREIVEGEQLNDRYVMWEYHGSLECEEICTASCARWAERRTPTPSTRPPTRSTSTASPSSSSATRC